MVYTFLILDSDPLGVFVLVAIWVLDGRAVSRGRRDWFCSPVERILPLSRYLTLISSIPVEMAGVTVVTRTATPSSPDTWTYEEGDYGVLSSHAQFHDESSFIERPRVSE